MSYQPKGSMRTITLFYDEEDERIILKLAREAQMKFNDAGCRTTSSESFSSDWQDNNGRSKGHNLGGKSSHSYESRWERKGQRNTGATTTARERTLRELDEMERNIESMEREVDMEEEELRKKELKERVEREEKIKEERMGNGKQMSSLEEMRSRTMEKVNAYKEESLKRIRDRESYLRKMKGESEKRRYMEERVLKERIYTQRDLKRQPFKNSVNDAKEAAMKASKEGEAKRRDMYNEIDKLNQEAWKEIMSIKNDGSMEECKERRKLFDQRCNHEDELRRNEDQHRMKLSNMETEWGQDKINLTDTFNQILLGERENIKKKKKSFGDFFKNN